MIFHFLVKSLAKTRPIYGDLFSSSFIFLHPSLQPQPSLSLVLFVSPPKKEIFLKLENGETEIKGFLELLSFHPWGFFETEAKLQILNGTCQITLRELKGMFALNEKHTSLKSVAPHLVSFLRPSSRYFCVSKCARSFQPACDTSCPRSFHEFSHQGHFTLTFIIYVSSWYCTW